MKKILLSIILLFTLCGIHAQKFDKQIEKMVSQTEKDVIEWRHWFHQNAELSNREFETAKTIAKYLNH